MFTTVWMPQHRQDGKKTRRENIGRRALTSQKPTSGPESPD